MLTGYSAAAAAGSGWRWRRSGCRTKVLELIDREAERAQKGEPARIIAKMNSLVDAAVIRALYAASQAGVRDRPAGARHLLPAAGRARGVARTSG